MNDWYYAAGDSPKGPVAQNELLELYGKRLLSRETLAWRNGLATWLPMGQIGELQEALSKWDVVAPRAAPSLLSARASERGHTQNSAVASKPKSSSTWIIVLVVAVVVVAIGVPLLAAIAIPQYQDYVQRARLQEGLVEGMRAAEAIEAYYDRTGKLPATLEAVDYSTVARLRVEFDSLSGVLMVSSGSLQFALVPARSPDGWEWSCHHVAGPPRLFPQPCREEGET